MRGLGTWTAAVHAHCLATRQPITPQQAQALFGPPLRSRSSGLLNSAFLGGYFEREEWIEEGRSKQVGRFQYRAVSKALERQDNRHSYFDGMKRVRSVFELAAA